PEPNCAPRVTRSEGPKVPRRERDQRLLPRPLEDVDNCSVEIRRIVVGVDGSVQACRAAQWAADLARAADAEVVAVHAIGLLHQPGSGALVSSDMHRDEIRTELEESWCTPLRDAAVRYRAELRDGNPVMVLLDISKELDADVVVVGSRGLGGFPGLLLGS